jgi:LysM repeat protein
MNNQSPLIPQGSLLEQKNKTRVRVKIAVIFVLALHGIGLLALLMQGCGHENAGGPGSTAANTNATTTGTPEQAPSFAAPSNPPETTAATSAPSATSPTTSATVPAAPTNQNPAPLPPENPNAGAAPPLPGGSDYKIVKGDTFSKVHLKFHVSLAALKAANPGVDSAKLKVGQTIHVPAPAAAATAPSGPGAAAGAEGAGGQPVYTVKSGDTLIKIARESGVKVKALREANNLKTNKIKVGQRLKLPPKTAAASEPAPAPAAGSVTPPSAR